MAAPRLLPAFLVLASLPLGAQDSRLVGASLARLRANDPKALEDVRPGSGVERALLRPEMAQAPWTQKVQGVEWLLRASILRQRGVPPRLGHLAAAASDPLLLQAWRLVQRAETEAGRDLVGSAADTIRNPGVAARIPGRGIQAVDTKMGVKEREATWTALEWLRLEVAYRLQDPLRMAEALLPYRTRKDAQGRELLHVFLASAHAGRWDLFRSSGEALNASGQLDRLRSLALADWSVPDYQALFKQVLVRLPAEGPGSLPPAELRVKALGLRLKSFSTPDSALSGTLKAAAAWNESGPVEIPLFRVGAVLHWLKPGAAPLPLVGGMSADALHLEGSMDLPLKGGLAWHKERFDLRPAGEPGRWTGTLEVDQQALEGEVPPAQVFHLSFEVRLDLESVASSSAK